jgi:hypothetical protein
MTDSKGSYSSLGLDMRVKQASKSLRDVHLQFSPAHGKDRTFNIADFTKNDTRVSVHERLHENQKFKDLAYNVS